MASHGIPAFWVGNYHRIREENLVDWVKSVPSFGVCNAMQCNVIVSGQAITNHLIGIYTDLHIMFSGTYWPLKEVEGFVRRISIMFWCASFRLQFLRCSCSNKPKSNTDYVNTKFWNMHIDNLIGQACGDATSKQTELFESWSMGGIGILRGISLLSAN